MASEPEPGLDLPPPLIKKTWLTKIARSVPAPSPEDDFDYAEMIRAFGEPGGDTDADA